METYASVPRILDGTRKMPRARMRTGLNSRTVALVSADEPFRRTTIASDANVLVGRERTRKPLECGAGMLLLPDAEDVAGKVVKIDWRGVPRD